MQPRPCRVRAVVERPKPPPWILAEEPYTEPTDWWPGTLLPWRWIDRKTGLWSGVVHYSHDGLSYLCDVRCERRTTTFAVARRGV